MSRFIDSFAWAPVALALVAWTMAQAVPADAPNPTIRFEDHAGRLGVDFRHDYGDPETWHLPQTMGAGLAWQDYDVDGDPDLYVVDGGPLPGAGSEPSSPRAVDGRPAGSNAWYRNLGDSFELVAEVASDPGWGTGVSTADYDDDGFPDLYVSNFGPDALYRNNGDGTFSEVTAETGLGDPRSTSSSVWADFDDDGHLDLFVVSYVDYDPATAPRCGDLAAGQPDYCHPSLFEGQADILYRNRGDGTFEDRSVGLAGAPPELGKGLAAAVADLDADGRPDIYVANDTTPNFVFLNRGGFRFEEAGVVTGAALGADGRPQAGMGVQLVDLDGDLSLDVLVTNFAFEPYNLYRQLAPGFFVDDTFVLGFGATTLPLLGFGVVTADFDADGDPDVAVANGHVLRQVEDFAQPNQVFTNRLTELRAEAVAAGVARPLSEAPSEPPGPPDWRPERDLLTDTTRLAGEAMTRGRISRGMAVADVDRDGLPDLGVSNIGDRVEVLINRTDSSARRLVLRLRGRSRSRQPIGALVWVTPCLEAGSCGGPAASGVAGFPQLFTLQSSNSFESQGADELYVGLGGASRAGVVVRWPGGRIESWSLPAGQSHLLVEGRPGAVSAPLRISAR